jgi:glycosyltransferase involved in cell wall biosynthesis
MTIAIGIVATEDADRLGATIDHVRRHTWIPYQLWLLGDGPDAAVSAKIDAWREDRRSATGDPQGMAACFNRLCRGSDAELLVLLEAGSLAAPGWLDWLVRGLDSHPANGLAGPSTNLCWNPQRAFSSNGDLAERAAQAASWYARRVQTLEPLYSLADFCYAVRREVVDAIGPADEAYGVGPCWEMDYNIRAARAGWRGVWVGASYVERMPATNRRREDEAALFERNKRLYQSKFCRRQLSVASARSASAVGSFFRSHCRGDDCPNFAPRSTPLRIEAATAPEVTCIMPTAGRRQWVARSIAAFLAQDFTDAELLILDDGEDAVHDLVPRHPRIRYCRLPQKAVLGAKRNLACEMARGSFIAHWDDDDWYPAWRLSRQRRALAESGDDVCGTSRLYYTDAAGNAFRYRYFGSLAPWVAGNTLFYRRSYWREHPFAEIQVGEDVRFLSDVPARRVTDLDDPRLCIATIHPRNTSAKKTTGAYWQRVPMAEIEAARDAGLPLVSCIMPTGNFSAKNNRAAFLPLALEAFRRQDYPALELVIVDDGRQPLDRFLPDDARVRYHRLESRRTVGEKRNIACSLAKGAIIAHWDDDDWYAPERIRRQAQPLIDGIADITGFQQLSLLALERGEFWKVSADLHQRMFVGNVHGGSVVYWKRAFENGIRYPDVNLAEDAGFLLGCLHEGMRLHPVANDGAFVYMRHGANTWKFQEGRYLTASGWTRCTAPESFPDDLMRRYREAAFASAHESESFAPIFERESIDSRFESESFDSRAR